MGNCSFKSVAISDAKESNSVRIMTDYGDIVEFDGPKFTGKVLDDFPGYGIFRQGRISAPLPYNEELRGGQIYFLLPLGDSKLAQTNEVYYDPGSSVGNLHSGCKQTMSESIKDMKDNGNLSNECSREAKVVRMSDNLIPTCGNTSSESTRKGINSDQECVKEAEPEPVRMSTSVEVLPPPQKGVWRVKFAIDTKQLEDILSKEVNTEALIQHMRMAASNGTVTPRRTKINWENIKPIISNVFKISTDQKGKITLPESGTNTLIQRKTTIDNELIVAI